VADGAGVCAKAARDRSEKPRIEARARRMGYLHMS
jgi:hypothetical protein